MNFETNAVRGKYNPNDNNHAINTPIYNTSAYNFETLEQAQDLYALKEAGHIYTRLSNPTTSVLEERLALLDGGVAALATSSGQSASALAVMNITKAGDEVVCASTVYGGTLNLLNVTLRRFGVNTKFVDTQDLNAVEAAISDKTKCIFSELLGNPKINVEDIESLAKIAHRHSIPLIIDNTVATPYLCRPFEWGADICTYSLTKFYNGHGNIIAGAIVDSGNFDWEKSGKFPELIEPDSSYHGVSYIKDFKKAGYIVKTQAQLLRDLGCTISPFNSYMVLMGIETLSVRMQRHSENALKIANFLESSPYVSWVNYPKLDSSPYKKLADKYLSKGASGLMGFGIKGDAAKFMEALKIFTHTANLGDVRSIATYPAGTTHAQLSEEQKAQCGVSDDFIRLSIGLENSDDLIEDLSQALKAAQ